MKLEVVHGELKDILGCRGTNCPARSGAVHQPDVPGAPWRWLRRPAFGSCCLASMIPMASSFKGPLHAL